MALTKITDRQVTYKQGAAGSEIRSIGDKLREVVSVKDFGALGDGSGDTPNDTGDDISNAVWNTWDGLPFKTDLVNSPYSVLGVFTPDRVKPFANDDTWDYIGISLALWSGANAVYIPSGSYKINMYSTTPKGTYPGLLIMEGQEQIIYGEGAYSTKIEPLEDFSFFAAATHSNNLFKLFTLYKTGGIPTYVRDILFTGPNNYTVASENLTLIYAVGINGVTFESLWITVSDIGMYIRDSSNDFNIKGCTAEYCHSYYIYMDATTEGSIDFCNLWASQAVASQVGVYSGSRVAITGTRFVGYNNYALQANDGLCCNNSFTSMSGTGSVYLTGEFVVSGNEFGGSVSAPLLKVVGNSTISGNRFIQLANQASIALGSSSVDSATNTTIVGNTFQNTAVVEPQNYAIIAETSGVSYVTAATPSVIITNNTFTGRALSVIGTATMVSNTFDGVLLPSIKEFYTSITYLATGASIVVSTGISFTYGIANVTVGGIVNGVGGVGGNYLCRYNNSVTTLAAITNMTLTCNDSAGTITLTNNTGNSFDGVIYVNVAVR